MVRRFNSFYRFSDGRAQGTILNSATFNRIFQDIDGRIASLEDADTGIEQVLADLRARGTAQINDGVQPILDSLDDIGLEELEAAQTALTNILAIEAQIEQTYNDLQGGDFPGDFNVLGAVTVGSTIVAQNLEGTNTGDETEATGTDFGLVRMENGAPNALVFSQTKINQLIEAVQASADAAAALAATNASAITSLQSDVTTLTNSVNTLAGTITDLTTRVAELENPTIVPADILYVVESSVSSKDQALIDELTNGGNNVTTIIETSNDLDNQAGNADLVVLGGDAFGYDNVHLNSLKTVATPILCFDMAATDNLQLGTNPNSADRSGFSIAADHPVTAGLSGYVEMLSSPQLALSWSPGSGGITLCTNSGLAYAFAYETGAVTPGSSAPARRVVISFDRSPLTAAGLLLFNNAIQWCLGNT